MPSDPAPKVGAALIHSDKSVAAHVSDDHQIAGRLLAASLPLLPLLKESEVKLAFALFDLTEPDNLTHESGEPFVCESQRRLRVLTGLGRAAVQRGLDALARHGILSVYEQGKGQDSAIYVLHFRARPPESESVRSRLARLRGDDQPALFCDGQTDRGLRTDASEARGRAPGGLRTDASEARGRAPGGLRTDASEARAGSAARGGSLLGSVVVVDVVPKTTATTPPDPRAELLAAERFTCVDLSEILAHPNCTSEQIGIAIRLADRCKSFRESRQAFIRAAIQGRWQLGRSAQQRRAEGRPEHVQERESAALIDRRAQLARERAVNAALAQLSDEQVSALMGQLIDAAPTELARRSLENVARDKPRLSASLRRLVFDRFCATT